MLVTPQCFQCDVERPCTMCSRTGVECVNHQPRLWYNQGLAPQARRKVRKTSNSVNGVPKPKRVRLASPSEQTEDGHRSPAGGSTSSPVGHGTSPAENERGAAMDKEPWRNSTSTMILVEEVRNQTFSGRALIKGKLTSSGGRPFITTIAHLRKCRRHR